MPVIDPVDPNNADEAQKQVLNTVQEKMGRIPNVLGTLAHSPAALNAYLGFSGAMQEARLSQALREKVALLVSEANDCDYCRAAHTAIAKMAGVDADAAAAARVGQAADEREQAVLDFSRRILEKKGWVGEEAVNLAREAGLSDAEIVETLAATVQAIYTNYLNHIAGTTTDFPEVPAVSAR
jgi:uncharacterized peroxidase-related enzyme